MSLPTDQVLVGPGDVAQMLGVSRKAIYSFISRGAIPEPFKLGSLTRWQRREIEAWIKADCPSATRWAVLRRGARADAGPICTHLCQKDKR